MGMSIRKVAAHFRVSPSTVHLWVGKAAGRRLDRVDWSDELPGCRIAVNRIAEHVEDCVLAARRTLREESPLGEYGACSIHEHLQKSGVGNVPSVRTIGRILERRGALDGNGRIRRPPPPRGWYLPEVASGLAEIDSFDVIEGLVIRGGIEVEVLTGIALHSGLCAAWPMSGVSAKNTVGCLLDHWRQLGLPSYAKFDNDTRFQGAHHHKDTFGRVTRLCLALGVMPVFAPPQEPGFQAEAEAFNGRWQAKVWNRFEHESLSALIERSKRFVVAARLKVSSRVESAPPRRPVPDGWALDLRQPLQGTVTFLRRTDERGTVSMLGQTFPVDSKWQHRLVRAEVDLGVGHIHFFALRRRKPCSQPLLRDVPYVVPTKRFVE